MTTSGPYGGGRRRDVAAGLRRTAHQAARVFRPTDGTGVLHLRPDEVDPTTARKVVDLAMRIAEMMLIHGASANDVTLTFLRVVHAYELRMVHVDVTFTSIFVSYYRGHDREPLTTLRVVRARSIDYTRLQRLQALVNRIEVGLDVDEAYDDFAAIVRAPHPYRRWVVTAANAAVAAGVCLLLDASPIVTAVAFLASGAIDMLLGWLARRQVPAFFMQALCAAVPTLAATGLLALVRTGRFPWLADVRPELVVAGGIVLMLSGMSVVGASQDAIDGYYITAGARTYEVLVLTLGIVVGVVASVQLGESLGVPIFLRPDAPSLANPARQVMAAMLISAFFAISTYAGPRTVVLCAGMGVLGWVGYLAATLLGLPFITASGVGAFLPGLVSVSLGRRLKVPSLALVTAALVPLMPGLMVYRGILEVMAHMSSRSNLSGGAVTLLQAAGVGIALAAGASLGTYLARPRRANLRHATPRGLGSAADTAVPVGSPGAEAATARAVEASTGTIPVVRLPEDEPGE